MCTTNESSVDLQERVAEVIEAIRPSIRADGGDIELVELTPDGVVRIRFLQACVGCPSAQITLKHGIKANLQARLPEITGVESVD